MGELVENKNNEIDLVDLLKIILRNKKIISYTFLVIFLLGVVFGIIGIKNSKNNVIRNFKARELNYFIGQNEYKIDVNIEGFVQNNKFIEKFNEIEIIKEIIKKRRIGKKDIFNSIYKLKKQTDSYTLEINGKDEKENEKLDLIFFEQINKYIFEFYGEILNKDFEIYKNRSDENKSQLTKIQKIIEELSEGKTEKTIDELRELNPTIFSEKDAITKVYSENYMAKEGISNATNQLKNLIILESSLNPIEEKISFKIILVISSILGVFLGIFIVFLKEFIKSINWKELKNI